MLKIKLTERVGGDGDNSSPKPFSPSQLQYPGQSLLCCGWERSTTLTVLLSYVTCCAYQPCTKHFQSTSSLQRWTSSPWTLPMGTFWLIFSQDPNLWAAMAQCLPQQQYLTQQIPGCLHWRSLNPQSWDISHHHLRSCCFPCHFPAVLLRKQTEVKCLFHCSLWFALTKPCWFSSHSSHVCLCHLSKAISWLTWYHTGVFTMLNWIRRAEFPQVG